MCGGSRHICLYVDRRTWSIRNQNSVCACVQAGVHDRLVAALRREMQVNAKMPLLGDLSPRNTLKKSVSEASVKVAVAVPRLDRNENMLQAYRGQWRW